MFGVWCVQWKNSASLAGLLTRSGMDECEYVDRFRLSELWRCAIRDEYGKNDGRKGRAEVRGCASRGDVSGIVLWSAASAGGKGYHRD